VLRDQARSRECEVHKKKLRGGKDIEVTECDSGSPSSKGQCMNCRADGKLERTKAQGLTDKSLDGGDGESLFERKQQCAGSVIRTERRTVGGFQKRAF